MLEYSSLHHEMHLKRNALPSHTVKYQGNTIHFSLFSEGEIVLSLKSLQFLLDEDYVMGNLDNYVPMEDFDFEWDDKTSSFVDTSLSEEMAIDLLEKLGTFEAKKFIGWFQETLKPALMSVPLLADQAYMEFYRTYIFYPRLEAMRNEQ